MQFTALLLAGTFGLATAASSSSSSNTTALVAELPSCSTSCLTDGAADAGCSTTDYSCMCSNMDAVTANVSTCLASSCSVTDISTTEQVVLEICDQVDNSTSTSTANTTDSTSSSSSSSSSASSTSKSAAAGRPELFRGLGWAAIVGLVGLVAL
ncbi:hypothetical protein BD289DRAFT_455985 [Coniella lustricola]|uniref:CFEM domain-containing protein n=1 Tax=Coniella lustricola TaxID=2025994 RepID=A0A2T2ZXK7_9PEZI|nr:hypothetical protein BD289DRAFT_455985 [Coniella lustricola]